MTTSSSTKLLPAIQGKIGDWYYYMTTLPLSEVAERVQPARELVTPKDMNEWIQREVIPTHIRQIADYLMHREQHFFPAIVVGVYLGEPTWHEINIEENALFETPALDPRSRSTLGLLELDGTERLYAIDGQHRVAGIKKALARLTKANDTEGYNRLASEDLAVVFVSADIDREGQRERVRRLFTTLNKQAKRVTEPEIVALDEDDPAAIVTRWIAIRYSGLKAFNQNGSESDHNLIQLGRQHEIRPNNRRSVTTIVTLYRMIKNAFQLELKEIAAENNHGRPAEETLENLYSKAEALWDMLRLYDPALGYVLASDPSDERAAAYRTLEGGHMLFRPVGLQAFSGALGVLRVRGVDTDLAVRSLCRLPTEISIPPWEHVVWNPSTRGMITANRTLAEALYLHMVGERPRTLRYPIGTKYREALGIRNGDPLQQVTVFGLE